MKSTEKLIYKNSNNESLEISYFSPYTPLEFSEDMDSEITAVKNNLQDGETFVSESLEVRNITIDGFFQLSRTHNLLERNLRKVFNPKLQGTLTFYALDFERSIEVIPESLPEIKKDGRRGIFSIELVAHNPFWREKEKTEYLALLLPTMNFPLSIPQGQGIAFGVKSSILETEIENVGDVESGFRVVFKARGAVENPSIINSLTGEQIKILYTMAKDDVIEVVNLPGKKQVLVNGVKAFRYLDRLNSVFFNLAVGKNLLGYQADVNTINLDVIVYYFPLYL